MSFGPLYTRYADLYYSVYQRHTYFHHLVRALIRFYTISRRINPLTVNLRRMNIQMNDPGISAELTLFKVHEPLSTAVLKKVLNNGDHCLEVGANIGYYTLLTAGLIGKEGRLTSAEPHPENYDLLLKNISMNGLENVTCFNVACSGYEGQGLMEATPQSNWHRLLEPGVNGDKDDGGVPVGVTRVDTLAKDFERLDFIRMDVEGHEHRVIEGSQMTIERFRPYLFMEFHPSLAGINLTLDLLADLKDYGYKIEHFIPRFLDWPHVGRASHVKRLSIDTYMDRIQTSDPIYGREANVFLKA